MAVQSLYRRYRPRRFDELKGQEHVVRALRNAVINHREGQAYLFSGPRGTGKTSTARILAKVLNCESPEDGEPCGICNSCGSIDSGNSYDVLELDAASNNGVENMRDLIERSSLGNPGRHRVFILDEVHMLSKAAEAALLKTLEEPPPHVVFVLATTDPQKVSETIRSRTQHLQFHLLPLHDLEEHVRWVIKDANLKVSEDAIAHVLVQGGGSARDTLSALELVAAGGGEVDEQLSSDEFIESIIDQDPARALSATAFAIQQGNDPRSLTEEIIRHLRECFLSLMAPELVQLPEQRATIVAEQARKLNAGALVRGIEVLGESLIEMRHAPDARLLLEVSLVKLTNQTLGGDIAAIIGRLERLEAGVVRNTDATGPVAKPAPVNPATGRVQVGGKARMPQSNPAPVAAQPTPAPQPTAPTPPPAQTQPTTPASDSQVVTKWPEVLTGLKPFVRALYSAVTPQACTETTLTLAAPNEMHMKKAQEHVDVVAAQVELVTGRNVSIEFTVDKDNTSPTNRTARPKVKETEIVDEVDRADIVDGPNVAMPSALDQLTKAFPGSQVVEQPKKK
ncbi:MAG: DNA polymerase III subunit gamma/tau [Actinobacteria bacterium]|nr:DNA polymerase III subunit gamma/tau [Actinomycetota bacterium]